MADRTKAELEKEAERLGLSTDGTKDELEAAIDEATKRDRPDTFERRFNAADRKKASMAARKAAGTGTGSQTEKGSGPDASAGVGAGVGTTTTATGTTGGGTTR